MRILALLFLLAGALSAATVDQVPQVIGTTGYAQNLQAGNRLKVPTATGGFFCTIEPGVQTATRVFSLPILVGGDTLVVLGIPQTFSAKITFPATTTAGASITLPHGTAPTSPVNGDLWTTTGGLFAQINGSTAGPFGSGGGTITGTLTAGRVPFAATSSALTDSAVMTFSTGSGFSVNRPATTGSEALGALALNATASGTRDTAVGAGSLAALTSGSDNTALGNGAGALTTTGSDNIFIGRDAGDNTAVGDGNRMVVGSDTAAIADVFFGNGEVNSNGAGNVALHATGGSGANKGGANLSIFGGRSTGSQPGGSIILAVSPAGGAGSSNNNQDNIFAVSASGRTDWFQGTALASVSASGSGAIRYSASTNTLQVSNNGGAYATINTGSGTVSSVAATVPAFLSVAGSPVTTSGTLAISLSGTALPVASGGTASTSALSGSSIMISNGSAVVQGAAGTTTTLLHGNAAGAPTYSAASLTADVSGVLPSANGGTGVNNAGTLTNATNSTITGGGTLALAGFTLTVPATGTAALLEAANTFTAANTFNTSTTPIVVTQGAATSGAPTAVTVTGAAHTGLTASTDVPDVNWNLARIVQHATGAITTQRAAVIQAPTYSFVAASTITNAATLAVTGPPVVGTNATITNNYAIWAQSGTIRAEGSISAQTNLIAGSGVSAFGTTDATNNATGVFIASGGMGIAKRSFLGTIGSTFKGNVLAGVQDATAAVSGQVGEVIESTISTPTNAAATTVYLALTSVTLTPGAWDISGFVQSVPNGATFTVDGATELVIGTTTASATGSTVGYDRQTSNHAIAGGTTHQITVPRKMVNISASTTYYANALATYSAGTPQWVGSISAVRIR